MFHIIDEAVFEAIATRVPGAGSGPIYEMERFKDNYVF